MIKSKKFVFVLMCLLFVPTLTANASEKGDEQEPSLADFLIVPSKGQAFSTFEYNNSTMSQKLVLSNANLADIKSTESALAASLLYGVTDKLSFGLDFQYTPSSDESINYVSSSYADYSTKSSGLYDPTLSVKGRIFGSQSQDMIANLYLFLSPNLMAAKNATKTSNGTMGKGGTNIGAGIEVGTPLKSTQIALSLGYTIRSDKTKKEADTGIKSEYSGGNSLSASLAWQVVMAPGVTGALFYSFQNVSSREIKGSGYTEKDGQYNMYGYGIALTSELNKNNLIAAAYSITTATDIEFDLTNTSSSGSIEDISGNSVTISWLSRF